MSLKEKVLLEIQNSNSFISGQQLANMFDVSRNAIWKTIKSLQNDGYKIESVTNKGYRIVSSNDVINKDELIEQINFPNKTFIINHYNSIDSTNNKLKSLFYENDNPQYDCLITIADKQTSGRGRFGREFYSPEKTGVYFSLLIKPIFSISVATLITTLTSVAICKAIEEYTSIKPGIKWINDIYYNKKKIAGILTEASIDIETEQIEYIIVGIGINLTTKHFPDDIADKAGSLNADISKSKFIGSIIHHFFDIYDKLPENSFIDTYKNYSIMLNKTIKYKINNVTFTGKVIDIDNNGYLIVSNNDSIHTLKSGEVTILEF